MHKVHESLKKYSHVNKKAFEQYSNFTKQREQLDERKMEIHSSAESIEELIHVLDQRKDEAIERTFAQVSEKFEQVWTKLVSDGHGSLSMIRRTEVCALIF